VENFENYEVEEENRKWTHISVADPFIVDSLEVFIDDMNASNNVDEGAQFAIALVDPNNPDVASDETCEGYFRRLNVDEYILVKELGYIRLSTRLRDNQVLAVAYKQRGYVDWVGTFNENPNDTSVVKLIRPQTHRPGQTTWDLEWKNVYSLGTITVPVENLTVRIFLDNADAQDDDSQSGVKYISIMGLDKFNNQNQITAGADGLFDSFDSAIFNFFLGELIFPALRPFDTMLTFEVEETLDHKVPEIFDSTNPSDREHASTYYIKISH
jgi:cell surface protein SprA